MLAVTNKRNENGVKDSADQYRNGGERVLWVDGLYREITLRVVKDIRAAGFKVWRSGDQVWVNAADSVAISALNINLDR